MRAPRALACSSDSRTMIADPSPSTNPSRAVSYGRDAASGSSLRVESACIAANPAIGSGWMAASVPPATTMSARPLRIRRHGIPHRLGAGRAGADRCMRAGPRLEVERHRGGRSVRHEHRHGERIDPAGALLAQDVPLVQQGPHPADPGPDRDRDAARVDLRRAGVGPGLPGGHEGVLGRRVEPPGLDLGQDLVRRGVDLAGEVHRQVVCGDPLVVQRPDAGAPGEDGLPRLGDGAADRRRGAETGHDDAGFAR